MSGIADLLRTERSFRRLWLSQVVSELGDWFQIVALFSMFPTRGRGAAVVAALFIARHVIATLMSPVAGVLADRYHRGHVMIAADLARVVVALGFLLVRGPEDVVLAFVLSLSLEALSMVFEPARGAAIPQVVPVEKLFAANALAGATWSAVLALGSVAGGATAALLGRQAAFAINAVSFALSALLVAAARVPPLPARATTREQHPLRDAREGLAYLRDHPPQAWILIVKSGALTSGGFFLLVTVFADQLFAGDRSITMGWMLAGRGLGALVFPFLMHRLLGGDVRGLSRGLLFAFPLSLAAFAAFSFAPSVGLAALALFFAHGGTSTAWVGSSQLLQITVPNRVLGRMLSVDLMLVTIALAASGTGVATLLRAGASPRLAGAVLASVQLVPFLLWARAHVRHGAALARASSSSETPATRAR